MHYRYIPNYMNIEDYKFHIIKNQEDHLKYHGDMPVYLVPMT